MAQPVTYIEKGYGLHAAIRDAGFNLWQENGVWLADNAAAVQALIDSFDVLAFAKARKIELLDRESEARIGLLVFIRAGTLTTVTATQFSTFMAGVTNRYRVIRQQINNATTVAEVQALALNTGWPANP